MDDDMKGKRIIPIYYICTGFSCLIIFITAFLILIYWKAKSMHSYPCYFNILLSIVIEIDNIIRIIPFYDNHADIYDENKYNFIYFKQSYGCYFQGYLLSLFDKIMTQTMTMYSIISFLGIVTMDFYKKNEKKIFISLTIISFLIPIIMTVLVIRDRVEINDDVCYISFLDDDGEIILFYFIPDFAICCILFLINLFCIIYLLAYICKLINKYLQKNQIQRMKNYYFHFFKFLVNLILTIITFTMLILIKLDNFSDSDEVVSLCNVILSLFIVLFYTLNLRVLKEGKNILCCKKEESIDDKEDDEDKEIEIV